MCSLVGHPPDSWGRGTIVPKIFPKQSPEPHPAWKTEVEERCEGELKKKNLTQGNRDCGTTLSASGCYGGFGAKAHMRRRMKSNPTLIVATTLTLSGRLSWSETSEAKRLFERS